MHHHHVPLIISLNPRMKADYNGSPSHSLATVMHQDKLSLIHLLKPSTCLYLCHSLVLVPWMFFSFLFHSQRQGCLCPLYFSVCLFQESYLLHGLEQKVFVKTCRTWPALLIQVLNILTHVWTEDIRNCTHILWPKSLHLSVIKKCLFPLELSIFMEEIFFLFFVYMFSLFSGTWRSHSGQNIWCVYQIVFHLFFLLCFSYFFIWVYHLFCESTPKHPPCIHSFISCCSSTVRITYTLTLTLTL